MIVFNADVMHQVRLLSKKRLRMEATSKKIFGKLRLRRDFFEDRQKQVEELNIELTSTHFMKTHIGAKQF